MDHGNTWKCAARGYSRLSAGRLRLRATSAGIQAGPQDVVIPARSRHTFNLGDYLTSYDVSTVVASSGPVVAERAMYGNSRTWAHDSVGWAP